MIMKERKTLSRHLLEPERGWVRGSFEALKRARRWPCIEFDIFSALRGMFFTCDLKRGGKQKKEAQKYLNHLTLNKNEAG